MLLACIGPDVFRALEKAHELEAAFRQKYDQEGSSIELLHQEGTELIDEVIERVNTVSLFTPRRFLRVRDLLKNCPKGRVAALEKALSVDPENVIVVTVESELPAEAVMKVMTTVPKWVRYDFPRMDDRALATWIRDRARGMNCSLDETDIGWILERAEGDTWQASLYLLQKAAGMNVVQQERSTQSVFLERSNFDWADAYIKQDPTWRDAVERLGPETLLYPFLSQLRAYERVKAGQEAGVPSFVVRKMKGIRTADSEEQFLRLLEAVMLQRQGYLREEELPGLL